MNKYSRLRPFTELEICECKEVSGIFLVDLLTSNPLHCSFCRKEIEPSRLDLDVKEIDEIANWHGVYNSLYKLWLHSGEYEAWAKEKLLDKNGKVNTWGLNLANSLSAKYPTSYWWFWDTDDGEPRSCPNCGSGLKSDFKWGSGNCRECRIII